MENNKPNDDDNPPASTYPLQVHVNTSQNRADYSGILRSVNNAGADLMSFPYMPLPVAPSPWGNIHGAYQSFTQDIPESGGNLMADLMTLNTLQNPQFDPNSTDIRPNIPILTPSEILNPEWNMRGIHQSGNHGCMVNPDNMMNCGIGYDGFQNSLMNRNFMLPRSHTTGGFQLTRQGGEAKSNINSPQIDGNLPSLRSSSTPMLYHTQNSGDTQIDNNAKVNSNQFGCTEKFDGSFLSLGIGGNTEARSKSTFSNREIARQLEETDSPQLNSSHVRQTTRNFSSLGHNLASGFPNFQGNARGLESPACNVGGWTLFNNDVGTICGANARLSSNALHILQAPQADMQCNISMPSNRNSGLVSKSVATYADLGTHKDFRGDQVASSGAFSSSSSAGLLSSGQFGVAPESANATWITTQTTSDQLQKCHIKPFKNFSSESSMSSPFPGLRGSSIRRDHSGQLLSAHDGSAAQAGGQMFPKRMGIQPNEGSVAQVPTGGLFPKRLGFEVNGSGAAPAAEGNLFSNRMGVQAASQPRGRVPSQFSTDLRGPSSTTGQLQHVVPSHFAKDLHKPVPTTGQGIPVANVNGPAPASNSLGQQSLKRGAIRPPPAAPLARRRKIIQRPVRLSMPHPPTQHAPPSSPVPVSTAAHIKWQNSDGTSEPSGQKCLLCKRDLSFTPEGPVYQPAAPPPVAVLPCGHTFHDHCLQIITPEDQAKDPPCIPCAIGEN